MTDPIINVVTIEGTKLSCKAGDTLVLKHDNPLTAEQIGHITKYAAMALPEGVKVAVLHGGLALDAVVSTGAGNDLVCEMRALRYELERLNREIQGCRIAYE